MARVNGKKQIIDYENSIKKSNELSMVKLSYGLSLNQMQLLAYAIYCTQQDGKTEFHKADFEKKFNLTRYNTIETKKDSKKLYDLSFSIEILEKDYFDYMRVFQRITYDKGLFTLKWSEDMLPHILDLKEKYIITDLTITAKFNSGFSWILYDYLKAHYGYWHKPMTKESLMKLFGVENKNTYQTHTGKFKQSVLDIAINEINEHTELEVDYTEEKQGRKIIGFDLRWSTGRKMNSATKRQIKELKAIVDSIFNDMYTYIKFDNKKNRERAIQILQNTEAMKIHTKEPICITKGRADDFIFQAESNLQELNRYLEEENNPRKNKKDIYYDWLN